MVDDLGPFPRLATGIPGLDPILEGGLLRGGVYMIQGSPGAGKTIMGNQICFHVAKSGGNAVYVTLLAEAHTRMLAHIQRLGFFDGSRVGSSVYYLSGFKVLESEGLAGLLRLIRGAVTDHQASFLVLDGLISAEEAAGSDKEFKKFIHELQTFTGVVAATAVLLTSSERKRTFHPEHTMVDGIIELTDELTDLRSLRRLHVRKLRGSRQVRGQHTLKISDEGVRVHARLETHLDQAGAPPGAALPSDQRLGFGIPRFDRMLQGGLPAGSMTLVLGPSGSGKTTLGLQFLAAGVRQGERTLFVGFYERPRALLHKGDRLNLGLRAAADQGLLELLWQPPVEGVLDVLGDRMLEAVRRFRPTRLVIDGIHGFQLAAEFPGRVRSVFAAFSEEFEAAGVTTLYTMETPDLFGPRIEAPVPGLSPITQNIILLRHVELHSRLLRLISVIKVRDSAYDGSLREFRITSDGIDVADTFESAVEVLTGSAQSPARTRAAGKGKRGKPKRRP